MPSSCVKITSSTKDRGISCQLSDDGEELLVFKKSKQIYALEPWQIWRQSETDVRFQTLIWNTKRSQWQSLVVQLPKDTDYDPVRHWLLQSLRANIKRRPKRLRVYINPVGGRKKALPNYRKIASFFELAGMTMDEVVTTHAAHCRDELQAIDLRSYNGIIIAGGDGFFSEAVHGLLAREDGYRLPIGLVPSGSTNTVAYSCAGSDHLQTWAFNVILGYTRDLDLAQITSSKLEQPIYATNFVCNGFFSSVVEDSERYRWMGPSRYSYSGFKQVMKHKLYKNFQVALTNDGTTTMFTDTAQEPVKLVAVALMSLKSPQSKQGLVPHAKLSSGKLTAVCVRKCTRSQWLRFLTRVSGPGTQWKLPYTTTQECDEMDFKSSGTDIVWNIDGEIHHLHDLNVTVLRAAVKLFDSSFIPKMADRRQLQQSRPNHSQSAPISPLKQSVPDVPWTAQSYQGRPGRRASQVITLV
eukprot:TRINITY_DN11143_c0_g1_i1.p1 TRINITY_DN11143_c0_g1~~TRINITY_DN11143_c0_g1_i1.p1  ORF type:complete len:468 (+),score=60.76 TRINITY_DN11143_c0_g1_i1:1065-2468(+)